MTAEQTKGRVLLADDEPALREVYGTMLQDAGYAAQTASNGREAMDLLWKGQFDLVLSDISMPGMDGLQLLRAVRERDLDVPVILMTGNPMVETAVQAIEYGALGYLLKPFREEALLKAVADAVRLHRLAVLKREALAYLGAEDKLLGDRAGLEAGFARALGSLWMAYQPIVQALDGQLFGYEALVRSAEPTLGHPGVLIDAAERLRRVPELGRVVRETVAVSMGEKGTVFVNVHSLELADEALYSPAAGLSANAKAVVLEITERASVERLADLRSRIKALRDLGYRIAVDDLGAGYAGLTSFAVLEPDVVKLDMALVQGVDREPIKRRLIGSMARVCKESGILVVAEGVETEAERDVLVELGCDLLQGYFFGRPSDRPQA